MGGEADVSTDHLVEIARADRPDGWYVATCGCGEHAGSQYAAVLDAWVVFHRAEAAASRPAAAGSRTG
jgi:hypothetical protein